MKTPRCCFVGMRIGRKTLRRSLSASRRPFATFLARARVALAGLRPYSLSAARRRTTEQGLSCTKSWQGLRPLFLRTRTSRSRRGHATFYTSTPKGPKPSPRRSPRRRDRPPESRPSQGRGAVREVQIRQGLGAQSGAGEAGLHRADGPCHDEEEIFYPACKEAVEEDQMNEAYVEHDGAKVLIAELIRSTPDQQFYDAKMTVLSEEIKHHVKEEERPAKASFPSARSRPRYGGARGEAGGAQGPSCSNSSRPADSDTEDASFTGHKLEQASL